MRASILSTLTLLLSLLQPTLARQPPTSYCKCVCFTNSTIIPLNNTAQPAPAVKLETSIDATSTPTPSLLSTRDEQVDSEQESKTRQLTCTDCTRAFCLDQDLPICKGAKEEDVFATCFQRDSLKDETIVLLFIVVTTGLLGWALLKPWIDRLRGTETVQRYAPIGNLNLSGLGRRTSAHDGTLPAYRDGAQGSSRTRDRGGSESFVRQGGLNS